MILQGNFLRLQIMEVTLLPKSLITVLLSSKIKFHQPFTNSTMSEIHLRNYKVLKRMGKYIIVFEILSKDFSIFFTIFNISFRIITIFKILKIFNFFQPLLKPSFKPLFQHLFKPVSKTIFTLKTTFQTMVQTPFQTIFQTTFYLEIWLNNNNLWLSFPLIIFFSSLVFLE